MIVVDASIAVKWVLPEHNSDLAFALRTDERLFVAPSLIVEEIGNVAWRRYRLGEVTNAQALDIVRVAIGLISRIVPAAELYERALNLAIDLDHPIYDCFYLALAQRESAPLASADEKLRRLAERSGIKVEGV
jgi:predicted nucleic acid-binding protein